MNEFHQENPVLYSTRPGTIVGTVADPAADGPDPVAPLARRAMIVLDAAAERGGDVTLRGFVDKMTTAGLDDLTSPAVTNATPAADWTDTLVTFPAKPRVLEETVGTATTASVCCADATPHQSVRADVAQGIVDFAAAPGEFISGGTGLKYQGPMTVGQDAAGAITLSFDKDGDDWSRSFGAPAGKRLKKGRYQTVARYGFAEADRPSLAVTGGGHACNEVTGRFSVDDVDYAGGGDRIATFSVTFEQVCDDIRIPLRGSLRMLGR